jgi:hypothetical protein
MEKAVMVPLPASNDIPGSFRDPSGFLFERDGMLYRQVNYIYKEDYERLVSSGLYVNLVDSKLLIPHEEVSTTYAVTGDAYKVLKPQLIPFVSYPYEWCFSQLKDAAILTLAIQKRAFDFGMSLKDCSVYNVQFRQGKPVFIDTLSFEKYRQYEPWVAYRQFCQHFLAPLALMSYKDIRLNQLFRIYIDGVPLDLASALLPFRTRFSFSLFTHIHLHARSQKRYADKQVETGDRKMRSLSFRGLIDSLESSIRKLTWHPWGTEWSDYYEDTNYSLAAQENKKEVIATFLDRTHPTCVWDLGANIGLFSRIASDRGIPTISFDIDPAAVEKNYLDCLEKSETGLLPLQLDLTNPSPGIGWANRERMSLLERGPVDMVFALALIHHLAISNNLPFSKISEFFHSMCKYLIVEFVPKHDSQVQRLLATREDIFPDYTQEHFEAVFGKRFNIQSVERIRDSERTLYLMARR